MQFKVLFIDNTLVMNEALFEIKMIFFNLGAAIYKTVNNRVFNRVSGIQFPKDLFTTKCQLSSTSWLPPALQPASLTGTFFKSLVIVV